MMFTVRCLMCSLNGDDNFSLNFPLHIRSHYAALEKHFFPFLLLLFAFFRTHDSLNSGEKLKKISSFIFCLLLCRSRVCFFLVAENHTASLLNISLLILFSRAVCTHQRVCLAAQSSVKKEMFIHDVHLFFMIIFSLSHHPLSPYVHDVNFSFFSCHATQFFSRLPLDETSMR